MRNRLIAEHLGIATDDLTREIESGQSLRAIVDAHASGDRTLVRVAIPAAPEPLSSALVAVADPERPISADVADGGAITGRLKFAVAGAVLGVSAVVVYTLRYGLFLTWMQAGGAAMVLILILGALRTWLFARRVSRIGSRHRREAEYG
jgi:hypothetical protein